MSAQPLGGVDPKGVGDVKDDERAELDGRLVALEQDQEVVVRTQLLHGSHAHGSVSAGAGER